MRYAANRAAAAARERFPARALSDADGDLWLVAIEALPAALNLTRQPNLDSLGLDDRISTGRIAVMGRRDPDPLLETCGRLADAVFDWWEATPPPLIYRTRSMPDLGRSVTFMQWTPFRVASARRLREAAALHAHLVLKAGFSVPREWIS